MVLVCLAAAPLRTASGNGGYDVGALWPFAVVGAVLVVAGWILYVLRITAPKWWPFRDRWRCPRVSSEFVNRAAWLDDVRARRVWRFDNELAATYDDEWSGIGETHASYVQHLVRSTPAGGILLDAACGTGRFFATVLTAGRRVVGTDESQGMLARACVKHPDVQTVCCRLQTLPFADAFDAALCVDAMEYVPPEDWPTVLGNLRRAVRAGGMLYLTVEIADDDEVDAAYREALAQGWPVLPGEVAAEGGRYHFYPRRDVVRQWLADSGLEVVGESDADDYWHLLCRV